MHNESIKIQYTNGANTHSSSHYVIDLRGLRRVGTIERIKKSSNRVRLFLCRTGLSFVKALTPSFRSRSIQFQIVRSSCVGMIVFFVISTAISSSVFYTIDEYKKIEIIKNDFLANVTDGIGHFKNGAEQMATGNWLGARKNFQLSLDIFTAANEKNLNTNSTVIQFVTFFNFSPISSAEHVLKAGESLSISASHIVELLEALAGLKGMSSTDSLSKGSVIPLLTLIDNKLVDISTYLAATGFHIDSVDVAYVPANLRNDFIRARNGLVTMKKNFQKVHTMLSLGKEMFGHNNKKYLFVFQNNNELRATGGFLGSFAVVSLENGVVKNINVPGGGSYDLQGSLTRNISSPEPLRLINPRWEFQDSNWWPDFPTSAKKMTWFYDQSGGVNKENENLADRIFGALEAGEGNVSLVVPTLDNDKIDGVIAINATFVENLLSTIGPVNIDKYNRIITSSNFISETQKIVEKEYDKTKNKPKEFIGDLMATLLKRIQELSVAEWSDIATRITEGLAEKDILLYLNDPDLQGVVKRLGWDGRIVQIGPKADYLHVVHTNIAGGKTDAVMKNSVRHTSVVAENGRIINTVEITRLHTGKKGEDFTGMRNVDYIRVYVPLGSKLLEAVGFDKPDSKWFPSLKQDYEPDYDLAILDGNSTVDLNTNTVIGQQFGKTFFANWVQTDPGFLSTIRLVYELPFTLDIGSADAYKIFIQKQSGLRAQDYLSSNLILPAKSNIVYQSGKNLTRDGNYLSYVEKGNKEDVVWGAVIGNE
jgi:hypothetical protein